MSIETKNQTSSNDETYNKDILDFFDNFIKPGTVVEEREVVDGMRVKLRVLQTEEMLTAEAVLLSISSAVPHDTLLKARAASILSLSIVSMNDMLIDRSDMGETEITHRRRLLYRQILKMPAIVIQRMYEFYIELVEKQNSYYGKAKETNEKMENFSQHRSEE